jgi:hypothetical protein
MCKGPWNVGWGRSFCLVTSEPGRTPARLSTGFSRSRFPSLLLAAPRCRDRPDGRVTGDSRQVAGLFLFRSLPSLGYLFSLRFPRTRVLSRDALVARKSPKSRAKLVVRQTSKNVATETGSAVSTMQARRAVLGTSGGTLDAGEFFHGPGGCSGGRAAAIRAARRPSPRGSPLPSGDP